MNAVGIHRRHGPVGAGGNQPATADFNAGPTATGELPDYVPQFNGSIARFFRNALRVSLRDPARALFVCRMIRRQDRAARVRLAWEAKGLHVPPLMIVSITNRCNLRCKGCYAWAQQRFLETEMSSDKLRSVVAEAEELGISIVALAGGEPLTRPEILDITREFPGIVFPLFTNGLLIDEQITGKLKKQKNVVPVISLEGDEIETDRRRGHGVFGRLLRAMEMMSSQGLFFGASVTLTRDNFDVATDRALVTNLMEAGCRLFFFIDYVPIQDGTESLTLTDEQRRLEASRLASFREELPSLFVAFPGDEEAFGGCLAAGRGFVHVSPEGRLEPCPASPFSDSSLRDLSLREALQSPLLRTIRDSGEHLSETRGGCALWERRDWVSSLLQAGGTATAGPAAGSGLPGAGCRRELIGSLESANPGC